MMVSLDFPNLLANARTGDEDAVRELIRRYEPEVRRAVQKRLASARIRRVLDSEDICQSVFAAFFMRLKLKGYDLEEPGQLLKLLVTMARNKLRDHMRRQQAGRRDERRIVGDEALRGCPDNGATPDRIVELRELLEKLFTSLPEQAQEVVSERAQGRGWEELSRAMGLAPDALRMRLRRLLGQALKRIGLGKDYEL